MSSRIEQFKALLRQDGTLGLTDDQLRHVATLLAFSGAGLSLPVWTTREEIASAPGGTLVESPAGVVYQKRALTGMWWETGYGTTWLNEEIELPVEVRYLP